MTDRSGDNGGPGGARGQQGLHDPHEGRGRVTEGVCVCVLDRAAASLSLIGGAEQREAGGVLGSGLIDS